MSVLVRVAAAFLFACPLAATAAPVAIVVRGIDGRPLAGAVVTLETPRASAAVPRGSYAVEQRNIAFNPHVLIVPVGATVAFPNRDKVRHHVYSFSKAKRFEMKLYGRDESRSIVFDHAGVVALGCNIHDSMSGFVFVTATPFAAQTDAAGRVTFDVPAGGAMLRVWDPSIRSAGNSVSQAVSVTASGLSTTVAIGR